MDVIMPSHNISKSAYIIIYKARYFQYVSVYTHTCVQECGAYFSCVYTESDKVLEK